MADTVDERHLALHSSGDGRTGTRFEPGGRPFFRKSLFTKSETLAKTFPATAT